MKLPVKKSLIIFIVCALGLSISFIIAGCNAEGKNASDSTHKPKKHSKQEAKKAADSAAVKVVVTGVTESVFEDWGSYSADLRGVEDAVLNAPYQGGRVTTVKSVGSYVKAGDALCGIDIEKYEAALAAAQAQLDLTKGDLDRASANVEAGSIGRSALDGANLAYQNSRMMYASAKRAYEDCKCQAPFDGVLVSRSIDKYQMVGPGMPTVRLSRIDRLDAVIAIPETDAFSYQEGMKAKFNLLQKPETVFEGKITSIDRVVDSRSRTVGATISLANRNSILKPGMVGRLQILRKTYKNAVVVPSSALLRLQNGISAMVVENGVARQRLLSIGAATADSSLVTEGLRPGDKLVVTGAFMVSEGTKVAAESVR